MRLVVINHKDYCLFGDEIGQTTYSFFKRHRLTFERMMEEQGHLFWRRYLVSFKAHCMDNQLISNPLEKGDAYGFLIADGFGYLDMQLLNCSKATTRTKAFIDDMAVLVSWKHLTQNINAKKRARDPFVAKDCRDVFRKVFGENGLGAFSRIKSWVFCEIYLRLAGALCMTLRRWMDAADNETDANDHSYWQPPPCDMFLYYSFSDEVFKLLPSEVDRDIPKIDRKEIIRMDVEKFGAEALDRFRPKRDSDSDSLSAAERMKGYKRITLKKPGSCICVEMTTAPLESTKTIATQEYGIVSFRVFQHSHSQAQYMRWKPTEVENENRVEEVVNSVIDLLTNEERKRFYAGILAEKERRKETNNPPPESPLLEFINMYTSAMTAIHDCEHPKHEKSYVYKRCSRCDKVEKKKKSFKICKICHDRATTRFRCYCSRDCQVLDWDRHRAEHREIERIKRVIEDDHQECWVDEFDRFSAGYFRTVDVEEA